MGDGAAIQELTGGRLHLSHGPIDVVLKAFGDGLAAQRRTLTPPPLAEPECPQPPADSTLGRLEPAPDTWQLGDPLKGVEAGVICYLADPWGSTVYENTDTYRDLIDKLGLRK